MATAQRARLDLAHEAWQIGVHAKARDHAHDRSPRPDRLDGLAMSPPRKKLLILLGAGSSVGVGLPTVSKIDALMLSWAFEWARIGRPDYYTTLEAAAQFRADSGQASPRPEVSFETVLGDMAALSQWLTPAPFGPTLRGLVGGPELPPDLVFPETRGYGPSHHVKDQLRHLLERLARHIRQGSRAIDPSGSAAIDYKRLLDRLRQTFDVGVYNLNYDTAALAAWPHARTGFVDGRFAPQEVHAREDWGFVRHLHGSVHHSLRDPDSDEILWRDNLDGEFFDAHQGHYGDERSGGLSLPKTTLIAGGFKLDQLLVEPFHSLHAALARDVHAAEAVLIGGYGFGDPHVNWALRNRLGGLAGASRPPIMVLDWAGEQTTPTALRTDRWATAMSQALRSPHGLFVQAGTGAMARPDELAVNDGFDLSPANRTGLWFGGFEQAARRAEAITLWLEGAGDALLA